MLEDLPTPPWRMSSALISSILAPRRPRLNPGARFPAHKFIDHTHADAMLALTNQTEAAKRVEEALARK